MVNIKRILVSVLAVVTSASIYAQGNLHRQSSSYIWPDDPQVLQKLEAWQDLKFGILLHWGVYSVPGICESWTITSEDWITPDPVLPYEEYKKWYWGLSKDFNPTKFNPEQWASVAKAAGMKYAVFTTKHHDGFCLWDTKETDYSVTHSGFAGNPRADAVRYVFNAFRQEGMMMGAYFSKPDWHSPYYWWPARATHDRYHNYPISQYPDRWAKYKNFVYNQVQELMTDYGNVDILWLDGGWCTAPREDIGLDRIVDMAREKQPGLIVVERACPGKFENYQTPEQTIPDHQILNPWESCITLTNDWGWVPKPTFKSTTRVIATLCEIVAKGGSLLLGVGPTPEGLIEEESVKRLQEIGAWMNRNGEAIYSTKPTPIYSNSAGNVWFTANKDGKRRYALVTKTDSTDIPTTLTWQHNVPRRGSRMVDLATGKALKWSVNEAGEVTVTIPQKLSAGRPAMALRFEMDDTPLYKDATMSTAQRVEDLLSRMTVEEKIGQLLNPLGWPMYEKSASGELSLSSLFRQRMAEMPLGSLWATLRADPWTQKTVETGLSPRESARVINMIQRYAVEQTRLGIPLLISEEAVHGHMAIGTTVFPTGIGMSCSWNPELLERVGAAVGQELKAQGANVGYGPVLDIARDPRWSRVEETLGEDPVLTGRLGAALVRGMTSQGVTSTLKHFTAYGVPEGGLNGATASVGQNTVLNELALPFREAIQAGAGQVMTSYNSVDMIPCSANTQLLNALLRKEWGFQGVVVSDLHAIEGTRGCTLDRGIYLVVVSDNNGTTRTYKVMINQ